MKHVGRRTDAKDLASQEQLFVLRNKIINGNFDVWQRGTSFASAGAAPYTVDRWAFFRGSFTAGATVSRQAGVRWRYCVRVQRDSGNTSAAPISFAQIIESANCYPLMAKAVTLRVRLRVGANFSAANLQLIVQTGTGEDQGNVTNPSAWTGAAAPLSSSIVPTTSFADYAVTATLGAGVKEIRVGINYTPVGTAGAADYFEVEEVQFEEGAVATPFEHRLYGLELALCQRYYFQATAADANHIFGPALCISGTQAFVSVTFPVPMRTIPATLTQTGVAANYAIASVACNSVPTLSDLTSEHVGMTVFNISSGISSAQAYWGRANASGAFLGFSAEL